MKKGKTTKEKKNYSQLVNEAVGFSFKEQQNSTLRNCFDPRSFEWKDTSLQEKVNILKKVLAKVNTLDVIISEYKIAFKNRTADKDIEDSLIELLQYLLTKGNTGKKNTIRKQI